MRDVTIIADDLTGAADTGIAFTVAGLPTWVSFGAGVPPPSAQIVAIDLDSRALPAPAAAERAYAATRAAYRQGTRTVYKKIDSTLRGNVGAEVAATWRAAAEAHGKALAIVSPAFPAMGRTVRGGRVLVNGVPLEQTDLWRTSRMIGTSGETELTAMLGTAGLNTANAGPGAALADDVQAVVCDAGSEDDLLRIAREGAALRVAVVWVGSAGLARHLPAALGLRSAGPIPASAQRSDGPILLLVGSRSSVAREQARVLAREPWVESFALHPDLLAEGAGGAGWSRAVAAVERALTARRDVVLTIEPGESLDLSRGPRLAAALGEFAAAQVGRIGGLIATGGDIARAALGAMGASGLHLVGEVEPGVPIGMTDTAPPLPVVTKAGAFGSPETLRRCLAALKAQRG